MGRHRARVEAVKWLLLLAAGCVNETDGGDWRDVGAITGALAPEVGPAIADRAVPDTLRIASWNVHFGADAEGLAAALASDEILSTADVIFTQEIRSFPNEPGSRASRMAAALGMTYVYAPSTTVDDGTHGVAILSRFPILHAEVKDLPHFHMPVGEESRIALAATLAVGRVVDIHLDVRLGASDRIAQLDPAVPDVGDTQTLALGGDFNSAPWSWVAGAVPLVGEEAIVGQDVPTLLDGYMAGVGWAGAIPTGTDTLLALPVRCDDLYARRVIAGGVRHVEGSDHWPIWMDVTTRPADP